VPVTDLGARGSVRGTPDGDVPLERMQVFTIQPGTLAYHGTFEANVEGIAENGICQMGRVAIHLFKTWFVLDPLCQHSGPLTGTSRGRRGEVCPKLSIINYY
jgi:hypothetical protein